MESRARAWRRPVRLPRHRTGHLGRQRHRSVEPRAAPEARLLPVGRRSAGAAQRHRRAPQRHLPARSFERHHRHRRPHRCCSASTPVVRCCTSIDDGPNWSADTSSTSTFRNTGSTTATAPDSLGTPRNDATVPKPTSTGRRRRCGPPSATTRPVATRCSGTSRSRPARRSRCASTSPTLDGHRPGRRADLRRRSRRRQRRRRHRPVDARRPRRRHDARLRHRQRRQRQHPVPARHVEQPADQRDRDHPPRHRARWHGRHAGRRRPAPLRRCRRSHRPGRVGRDRPVADRPRSVHGQLHALHPALRRHHRAPRSRRVDVRCGRGDRPVVEHDHGRHPHDDRHLLRSGHATASTTRCPARAACSTGRSCPRAT